MPDTICVCFFVYFLPPSAQLDYELHKGRDFAENGVTCSAPGAVLGVR